jgi:hypothetical protein
VLVDRGRHAGRHDRRRGVCRAVRHRRGGQDAGELDLQLQRAVLVEGPVEAVVVVAHGRDRRHDQPPPAPDLGAAAHQVVVLPADADVLLVEADGVGHGPGRALLVGQDGVQVPDLAQAVAAVRERVGEAAEAPLADVERVLPAVPGRRVAVGDHHLADRRPPQDRPFPVGHIPQHDSLERVEAHVERPALPPDLVAVDREAHAVGLGDDEGR